MGIVFIQDETTKDPLSLMGKEAGICWGAEVGSYIKNCKRGGECILSDHGRVMEYVQIYLIIKEYSAKFGREFYTHIGGAPTRLQESTRRVSYNVGFGYTIPPSIRNNDEAYKIYTRHMTDTVDLLNELKDLGIPNEDATMILPLAIHSGITVRTNLRNLIDMSKQRLCTNAYWEYRDFFNNLVNELKSYSKEWKFLIENFDVFKPKCEYIGYCNEKDSCGRTPTNPNRKSNKDLPYEELL